MSERSRNAAAIAVLAALACAFLWRPLFTGRVLMPTDMLLQMEPWRHYAALYPESRRPRNPLLDPIQQYLPWRTFGATELRRGNVPLWNPYMFSGAPFVGTGQSALFYPPNLLFVVMKPIRAFGWLAALQLFMASLFMYLLARHYRLHRFSALTAAIVFTYSGFFVAWLQWPTFLSAGLWLPLIILLFERAIAAASGPSATQGSEGEPPGPVLLRECACGVAVGLSLLGGHLQIAAYAMLAFIAYAIYRAAYLLRCHPSERRLSWACPLGLAAVALAVGAALAGAQVWPSLQMGALNFRKFTVTYAEALSNCLPPRNLLTFLVPGLFGDNVRLPFWGFLNYIETAGYVGILPLLLIPFALRRPRHPHALFYAGLWLAALLLAFGTPLNRLVFALPGFSQLTALGRALYLHCFAAAMLAGMGSKSLKAIAERADAAVRRRLLRAYVFTGLAAVGVVGLYLQTSVPAELGAIPGFWAGQVRNVGLLALLLALSIGLLAATLARGGSRTLGPAVPALIAADLFVSGCGFNPVGDPRIAETRCASLQTLAEDTSVFRIMSIGPKGPRGFLDRMPPNLPMLFRLQDVQGSDSLLTYQYHRLRTRLEKMAGKFTGWPLDSRLLDLLNVKYVLTSADLSARPDLALVSAQDMRVYRRLACGPRAFVTAEPPVIAPTEEEALEALLAREFDPARPIFIHGTPGGPSGDLKTAFVGPSIMPEPPAAGGSGSPSRPRSSPLTCPAQIVAYEANRVHLRVFTPWAGWLILADHFYPGWRAFVDGREQPVVRVDFILRAVRLESGDHRVHFVYLPSDYRVGLFASLAALALVTGVTMATLTARAGRGKRA